jgi:hypothetical protein
MKLMAFRHYKHDISDIVASSGNTPMQAIL